MIGALIILGAVLVAVALLFWMLRDDIRSPAKEQGLAFCGHCGALWDARHENDGCPVMGATSRILGASDEEASEHQRDHRHGLRETTQAVSGRADW